MKKLKITIATLALLITYGCDKSKTKDSNQVTTTQEKTTVKKTVNIGTGSKMGIYYPAGEALCDLVNNYGSGINCSVESTGGSIYNLNSAHAGEFDFIITQADWLQHAYNGTSKFAKTGAFKELRIVLALHPESLTVIARADVGATNFDDLKGKRINIGNFGSGTRATMEALLNAKGWNNDSTHTTVLKSSEQTKALCDNKVDAIAFVSGHPSNSIKDVLNACDSVIVPITGADVDTLIADNSFYHKTSIAGDLYNKSNNKSNNDIATFGVDAMAVASIGASVNTVYQITKAAITNIEKLRKKHPAFTNLTVEEMARNELAAPSHLGAIKAFKESGVRQ